MQRNSVLVITSKTHDCKIIFEDSHIGKCCKRGIGDSLATAVISIIPLTCLTCLNEDHMCKTKIKKKRETKQKQKQKWTNRQTKSENKNKSICYVMHSLSQLIFTCHPNYTLQWPFLNNSLNFYYLLKIAFCVFTTFSSVTMFY